MKISVSFSNLAGSKIEKNFATRVISETASRIGGKKTGKLSLSVVAVKKEKMKQLNLAYRGKNRPTDVLSFNYFFAYNEKGKTSDREINGEIFLCPEVIQKNARGEKIKFRKELARVISHGFLHLIGLDHSKKMFDLQDEVSESF